MKIAGFGGLELFILGVIAISIAYFVSRRRNVSGSVVMSEGVVDDGTTIHYPVPLSKSDTLFYKYTLTQASDIDVTTFIDALTKDIVEYMAKNEILMKPERRAIIIGFDSSNAKSFPGVIFAFADKPEFATFLLGVNKIAGTLDVYALDYGAGSKNRKKSLHVADKGEDTFIGGFISGTIDQEELEVEERYYELACDAIAASVEKYTV